MARQSVGPWYRESKNAWYVKLNGRQVALGVSGETNRKAAKTAWHRLMSNPPTPKATTGTVNDVIDAFLSDAESRCKPPTMRLYRVHADAFRQRFGSVDVDTLTVPSVLRWLNLLTLNSTTKAMTLRSLSACFAWAVRNGLAKANIVKAVPKPKSLSRSQDAVIDADVYARMLAIASPSFQPLLQTLYATGCRPGEACRMTVESFNADASVVILNEHKAERHGKPRIVFLSPDVCELLKRQSLAVTSGVLFRTSKGKAWTPTLVNQAVRRLALSLGIKAMPYGFRHGFATRALAKGIPDAHVASLLGHTSTAMLYRHYSHLTQRADVLRQAVASVA